MPIFEYKCTNCDNRFEQLVYRSSDKIACPACNSEAVEKYVSTFASNAFVGHSASCNNGSCSKKSSFG
jgi:putative FmdB family regulatory protein